jgi:hypothetical protein
MPTATQRKKPIPWLNTLLLEAMISCGNAAKVGKEPILFDAAWFINDRFDDLALKEGQQRSYTLDLAFLR